MNGSPPLDSSSNGFSANPAAWLAVAYAAGVTIASFSGIDWKITLLATCILFAFAVLHRGKISSYYAFSFAFLFLGAFWHQFGIVNIRDDRIKRIYDEGRVESGTPVEVEGTVAGRPEPSYDGVFIRLETRKLVQKQNEQNASGTVRLFVPLRDAEPLADLNKLDLRSGSRIRVACELMREDQFLNPGVTPRLQVMDQQGFDAVAAVKSPLLIEKMSDDNFTSPLDFVYEQRSWLIDEFRTRFNPQTAGVMAASLLGDKNFLDKYTANIFREGGTFHILVISGLHITFIGGILLWLAERLTRNRTAQLAMVAASLWAYTFAVGAETPIVRASLMFTLFLMSRAIYRNGSMLNTLGLSCLFLLAWRPGDLFSPSFQLTIVSVTAIVAIAFPLVEKLRSIGRWMPDTATPFPPDVPSWLKRFCETLYWNDDAWEIESERQIWSARMFKRPFFVKYYSDFLRRAAVFIFEGFTVSLIVQMCMLPLLVYYFHRVSPAAILLNLWVSAVIALESFAAILTVTVAQFGNVLTYPFAAITQILNWLLLFVPRCFVDFGWASFRVPIYAGSFRPIYTLYFIPVVLIGIALYRWKPFELQKNAGSRKILFVFFATSVTVAVIMGGLIVLHPMSSPKPDGKLHVEFLDVGQGDAAFITFPNGETMLIDGGGRINYNDPEDDDAETFEPDVPRIGEKVVSEFLWENGYSRVDNIVATHADADHVQGLADIVRNFDTGSIYVGSIPDSRSELDELLNEATRHGIEPKRIGRGDNFEIGGVKIEVLWPIKGAENTASDNNSSLVIRLVDGERSFLFTGDIEREAETALIASGTLLNADVVKVPHHGSRSSSTEGFINALRAQIAVISVGKHSIFGHPHPEVVERWKIAGTKVMTTGERGTITVSTDGRDLQVNTFVP